MISTKTFPCNVFLYAHMVKLYINEEIFVNNKIVRRNIIDRNIDKIV